MLALVTAVSEDELSLRTTEQDVAIAIGDSEPGHYDRVRVGMTIAIESDDETGAVSIGEASATREELLAFWQAVGVQEALLAAPADTLLKALAKNPASQIATTTHLLHILRRLAEMGGMTVKEINAAFGERAGELKKPAKRVGLIDMGLIHLFMM